MFDYALLFTHIIVYITCLLFVCLHIITLSNTHRYFRGSVFVHCSRFWIDYNYITTHLITTPSILLSCVIPSTNQSCSIWSYIYWDVIPNSLDSSPGDHLVFNRMQLLILDLLRLHFVILPPTHLINFCFHISIILLPYQPIKSFHQHCNLTIPSFINNLSTSWYRTHWLVPSHSSLTLGNSLISSRIWLAHITYVNLLAVPTTTYHCRPNLA